MFRAEWGYFKQHKFYILVLTALLILPSIYAVVFLSSLWDPYGKVSHLPVAVVNQDKSVTYNKQKLAVGKDLAKSLSKSDAMDFRVVSENNADKGLDDGKYYMKIVVPKDFSERATTLLDKNPKEMTLHYETSTGHSFIAGKMSESAATKIINTVSKKVTKTYTKTIVKSLKELGGGMKTAGKANKKLASGTSEIISGNDKITTNLQTLASSSLTFKDGADTLSQGLGTYVAGVSSAANGSQQLTTGINSLSSQLPTLTSGVSQLQSGSSQLTDGTKQYTSGVEKLSDGSKQLMSGVTAYTDAVEKLSKGSADLASGVEPYAKGVNTAYEGSKKLSDGLTQLNDQISSTASPEQVKDLSTKLTTLQDEAKDLSAVMPNSSQMDGISTQLNAIKADMTKLADAQKADTISTQQKVTTKVAEVVNTDVSDDSGVDKTKLIQDMTSGVLASQDTSQTAKILSDIQTNYTNLMTGLTPILNNQTELLKKANDLQQAMTALGGVDIKGTVSKLEEATQGISTLQNKAEQLTTGLSTLNDKSSALVSGSQQITSGLSALQAKSSSLVSGSQQISDGLGTLNSKSSSLVSGSQQVTDGLSTMAGKMPALSSGVTQLSDGSKSLTSGLGQLVANNNKLTSGVAQLSDGANKISDGSGQLASGSMTLGDALNQVQSGNKKLSSKLTKAGNATDKIKPSKKLFSQLTSPVAGRSKERDTVANNGTGMTPYMFSVGLYVGMLAFNLMMEMGVPRRKPTSALKWFGAKMSLLFAYAIVAASIVYGLSVGLLGLDPVNPLGTYVFTIVIALTFSAIVTALNLWLDKPGAFVAVVFLVLQLSGSAGTYPIQLSNSFFEWLHPYLPMTYAVDGLRETIMIGGSYSHAVIVLLAIFVVFTLAMFIFYVVSMRKYSMMLDPDTEQENSHN